MTFEEKQKKKLYEVYRNKRIKFVKAEELITREYIRSRHKHNQLVKNK